MANRMRGGACCPSRCQPACPPCPPPGPPCDAPLVRLDKLWPEPYNPCSFKNCLIFGGHDEPYIRPFDPKGCTRMRRNDIDRSLGYPIGVVSGTTVIKSGIPNQESVRFASNLKAFAHSYYTRRDEWKPDTIDMVVNEGQVLFNDSENMDPPNASDSPDIYDENEQKVTRHFKINDIEFAMELEAPFEVYGYENVIRNLRRILRAFFKKAKYGVFFTPNWYLLIWKEKGVWMVLDLNGRDKNTMKPNNEEGYPLLLGLKSFDNVVWLIKKESYLDKNAKFSIREILVVRLATPGSTGQSWEREHGMRMSQFDVIASDYAYVKSNLHLTLNSKDALRNRSALPVAVATALASKIDHPATWDQKMYDKVMCYGVNMCKNCWEPCMDPSKPMDLDDFPRQIRLGQFVAEIMLTPNAYEGWWKCVPMYKFNDFHLMLEKALDQNDYIIFQINNQMYSLWKKSDFIYLMDPYRHNIVGRILEEGEDPKSATVRMFGNMDRLLSVFHQILLESNRSAVFHIHTLRIRNITECPPGTAPALLPPDEDVEVRSLNENIRFDENYDKCLQELGEISDFEEDLVSEIEPIVEISSSEEMVEEEEGGGGGAVEGGEGEEDDED
uniref:GH26702p n=1 Tax=Drosophila melanogaster TaxID=7227 RepID=Q961F4_DROME|nr:GH26702p [Drosophila melanogaster]